MVSRLVLTQRLCADVEDPESILWSLMTEETALESWRSDYQQVPVLIDMSRCEQVFHREVEQDEFEKFVRVEDCILGHACSDAACGHGMLASLRWVGVASCCGEGYIFP